VCPSRSQRHPAIRAPMRGALVCSHYVAATFIGTFFPESPLAARRRATRDPTVLSVGATRCRDGPPPRGHARGMLAPCGMPLLPGRAHGYRVRGSGLCSVLGSV
jgi:hypothetical protein